MVKSQNRKRNENILDNMVHNVGTILDARRVLYILSRMGYGAILIGSHSNSHRGKETPMCDLPAKAGNTVINI